MAFDQDQQPLDDVFQPEDAGARQARRDANELASAEPPKSNGCRNIAIGCGCLTVLLVVVAVGVGIWAQQNWKGLAADFAKQVAQRGVASCD